MGKTKAILLVRVSTTKQNFDEQERQLYNLAIRDGFSPEDIILIAHKESARKLDEQERLGLSEMKSHIENDPTIRTVYAWEVSRIARTKAVLFNIQKYLLDRNIQLIIHTPSIRLLTQSGELDPGADMVFTLYGQMAEMEMTTKIARVQRTMRSYTAEGKFTGSRYGCKFGYKVDPLTKKLVINPDEAAIIREIYDLYITNPSLGVRGVMQKMQSAGHDFKFSFVEYILREVAYTGAKRSARNGILRPYPTIITKEIFEEARNVAGSKVHSSSKVKNLSFLSCKLANCPVCGALLTTHYSAHIDYYRCATRLKSYRNNVPHCGFSNYPRTLVDSVAWHAAKSEFFHQCLIDTTQQRTDNEQIISKLKDENKNLRKQIDKLDNGLAEGKKLVLAGLMSSDELITKSQSNKVQIRRLEDQIASNEVQINQLSKYNNTSEKLSMQEAIKLIDDIEAIDNRTRMNEIIHQFVQRIEIVNKLELRVVTITNCTFNYVVENMRKRVIKWKTTTFADSSLSHGSEDPILVV